jgi:outer membrane murein-binding lipoprotein Lpp
MVLIIWRLAYPSSVQQRHTTLLFNKQCISAHPITRRISLEADKRQLADKASSLQARLAVLEREVEAGRRQQVAARQEQDRAARALSQRLAASESRAAALLQALEGAEVALRDSQATATRLLMSVSFVPPVCHV